MSNNMKVQNIIKHCAYECARQQSGEMSVSWMFDAWLWTVTYGIDHGVLGPAIIKPNVKFFLELAKIVEPVKNANGFRTLPVIINETVIPVTDFESNLSTLIENGWFHGNAEQFYFAFEKLHPFIDGNGRIGNIVFNLLNGTIYTPAPTPVWK